MKMILKGCEGHMNVKAKQLKKQAGATLVELMIAVTILALVTFSVLGLYYTAVRINMLSRHRIRMTYAAELRMEELIGLSAEELYNEMTKGPVTKNDLYGKDYAVTIFVAPAGDAVYPDVAGTPTGDNALRNLVEVTVGVYRKDIVSDYTDKDKATFTINNILN